MDLKEMLEAQEHEIISEATESLERAHLRSYERSSPEANRARIADLYSLLRSSIEHRDLMPMMEHARRVANHRYMSRFDLQEVQTAFNVLEEVVWRRVADALAAEQYPEAFGLVSTVLGAGKEALATEYVSLASHSAVRSFDLSALFRGG
jgi:hypothetical protein